MTSSTLPEARLDLWLVWSDRAEAEAERDGCQAILSQEECARGARFVLPRDRKMHLLTRALVRVVLGRYLGFAPHGLAFERNAFGKPDLVEAQKGLSRLAFNVSHAEGLILLGVTCGPALGVDVESLQHDGLASFAGEFMTAAELAAAARLDGAVQHRRHLETWTLKEAYIKARSLGLTLPLRQMAFDFADPARPRFSAVQTLAGEAERWGFYRFAAGDRHVGAACVPTGDAGVPVRATAVTPLLKHAEPVALDGAWTGARPERAEADEGGAHESGSLVQGIS